MRQLKTMFRPAALALAVALVGTACGGDGETGSASTESETAGGGEETAETEGSDDGDTASGDLGVSQVRMAVDGAHFMNAAPLAIANEQYWPDLGFTEEADVAVTSEVIPAVLGGDAWIGQVETQPAWAAMSQGAEGLTAIGVEKGYERWILGATEGIESAEDLVGKKVTGGPPGERNVTVLKAMLEEIGLSEDDVEIVTVEGGSDEYFRAMVAGQVVAAPIRDRHLQNLEEEGGTVLFEDVVEAPQEIWVAPTDFVDENPDAVAAFLEGVIAAKQWAAEGPEKTDNRDEAFEVTEAFGFEPETGEYDAWPNFIESNWAMSGGATAEAFDEWTEDMVDIGIVDESFVWQDHVSFEPLWQAQEALGMDPMPAKDAMNG